MVAYFKILFNLWPSGIEKKSYKIPFQMVCGLRFKYMTSQIWKMHDDDTITFSLTVKWRPRALYNAGYFHSKLQIVHYQPKCHLETLQDRMEILNRLQIYVLLHRNITVRRCLCTVQYFFWKEASNQQAELIASLYKASDMPSKVCYTDC